MAKRGGVLVKVYQETERDRGGGGRNDPNEKDLCRHCETISFCRLRWSHSHVQNGQGDLGTQLFSPIKGNICQDHKSSYWTVIY